MHFLEIGQKIRLNGRWGGFSATVVQVNGFAVTIQFDDQDELTRISTDTINELSSEGKLEVIKEKV